MSDGTGLYIPQYDWDGLPGELRARRQFVLWKLEQVEDRAKPSKVPYLSSDTDRRASPIDSRTWGMFADTVAAYRRAAEGNGIAGIGYVLTADDPYVAIDLDGCRCVETGIVEQWAQSIIDNLDTYTEVSPSGRGIRMFVRATLPNGSAGNKRGPIEIYYDKRYVTVTGMHIENTPATIESRPERTDTLWHSTFGARHETRSAITHTEGSGALPDSLIVHVASTARNGALFRALWSGDISAYPSQSEADLALCGILAFYTRDAYQIDRLVRDSGLVRDKWTERAGYRNSTIRKALNGVTAQYNSQPIKRMNNMTPNIRGKDTKMDNDTHDTIDAQPNKVAIYDDNGHLCNKQPGLVCMSDVKPESVRWLWRGWIPLGKLTILDGDPGLGKSLVLLDISARVTTGSAMPDGQYGDLDTPCGVVLLSAEDDLADTIRPRLDAAGADVTRVAALTHVGEGKNERFPTIFDIPQVESAIKTFDAKLLVIDPIMSYLPGDVNSHRDQDVRRALIHLTDLAQRTGVAVVVIRHLNKQVGPNPLYRGGGSIALIGTARSGLLIAPDPDDLSQTKRILVRQKSNTAAPVQSLAYQIETADNDVAQVHWLGASHHTAHTVLAIPVDTGDNSAVGDAAAFLTDLLQDGALPVQTILDKAKDAGMAEKTLRRAKDKINVVAKREAYGPGGRWLWELPKPGVQTA